MTDATPPTPKTSKIIKYGGGFFALIFAIVAVRFVIVEPWWMTLGAVIIIGGIWKGWTESKQAPTPKQSFDEERYGVAPSPTSAAKPKTMPASVPTGECFHWPELGGFEYSIVGTSFYQDALQEIAGEHPGKMARVRTIAHLIPDPKNKFDDKAVRVDIAGHTVGHLSKEDARSFRRRLGAKKIGPNTTTCAAEVWGGNVDRSGKEWGYGVKLDIKPFGW
jgi:hypothetical protein